MYIQCIPINDMLLISHVMFGLQLEILILKMTKLGSNLTKLLN